jgi:hypothetical protein
VIKHDLLLLTNILRDISKEADLSPPVELTLKACQAKVEVINSDVTPCEVKNTWNTENRYSDSRL